LGCKKTVLVKCQRQHFLQIVGVVYVFFANRMQRWKTVLIDKMRTVFYLTSTTMAEQTFELVFQFLWLLFEDKQSFKLERVDKFLKCVIFHINFKHLLTVLQVIQ
jgi:hypothetical protein